MPSTHVRSILGLLAGAAFAIPAAAALAAPVLPPAQGAITFSHFLNSDGSENLACGHTSAGPSSATCSGVNPESDEHGIHIIGHSSGVGTISSTTAAGPKVDVTLSGAGGDTLFGFGVPEVTTDLTYFVTVVPLTALGTNGLLIPLTFEDAGSISGLASSHTEVSGQASTEIVNQTGQITVDGQFAGLFDTVNDDVSGSSFRDSYGTTHQILFDFRDHATVARVTLKASCSLVSNGEGSGSCAASADPFVGFDQQAFDGLMGANTFNLSDAFRIEISAGLTPGAGGGVPEPATWALMIAGFGFAGAALRWRRAAAA